MPIEFCEVWFSFSVSGDSEAMYTHLGYGVGSLSSQAAVDAGFASFITQFKPLFASTMTLNGGHVLEQTTAGILRWDASVTPAVGTGAGSALPNNCATLIKKSTALGGRRNRGRMYFPCPLEASADAAGVLTSGNITAWNTAVALLMTGGTVHTAFGFLGDPVVFHDSGSQTPTEITDLGCQSKIATQRRRMRR